MLEIDKEFKKGILFVRLKGILTKDTVSHLNREVTKLIADMQIQNVVFNIQELTSIDLAGINAILYSYNMCKDINGISMLCGVNSNIKDQINKSSVKDMFQIKDELTALKLIKI